MRVIPNTGSIPLAATIGILSSFYGINGIIWLFFGLKAHWLYLVFAICFWLPISAGLWRLLDHARLFAMGLQILMIPILPALVLGKWAGLDTRPMLHPPTFWKMAILLAIAEGVNLCLILILDKHKREFRTGWW
jgi:hypothetical protein